jgi:hypothetical protein
MGTKWKLVALAAAFSMLVAPVFGATAASKAKIHHRHYVAGQAYYPVPAGYHGVWYASGWRHRSNAIGWDNTCLDVPWLLSQFACSAGGY